MAREGVVRKNPRLTQERIDRAEHVLGTETGTGTLEQALDLVPFRTDVLQGMQPLAGSEALQETYGEDEAA